METFCGLVSLIQIPRGSSPGITNISLFLCLSLTLHLIHLPQSFLLTLDSHHRGQILGSIIPSSLLFLSQVGPHLACLPYPAPVGLWWLICSSTWPLIVFPKLSLFIQGSAWLFPRYLHMSLSCRLWDCLTSPFFPEPCLDFCSLPWWAHQFHGFYHRSPCWWHPCFDLRPDPSAELQTAYLTPPLRYLTIHIWNVNLSKTELNFWSFTQNPSSKIGCQLVSDVAKRSGFMMTENWLLDLLMWEAVTNRERLKAWWDLRENGRGRIGDNSRGNF